MTDQREAAQRSDEPTCVYCGEQHRIVWAEHDCPNSMGLDAASAAMTIARRGTIKPPGPTPPPKRPPQ